MNEQALKSDLKEMMDSVSRVMGAPFANVALMAANVPTVLSTIQQVGNGTLPPRAAIEAAAILFERMLTGLSIAHDLNPEEITQQADVFRRKLAEHCSN